MSHQQSTILTFGYGKRSFVECQELLGRYGIEYLIDVRSVPWSKFRPQFGRDVLKAAMVDSPITYLYMGNELGGMPDDPDCYDADGHIDYLQCRRRESFKRAIERLRQAAQSGYRVALMCAEARPENCHRTKLVAATLIESGVDVQHIDELGVVRSHIEIVDRLRANQMSLLE